MYSTDPVADQMAHEDAIDERNYAIWREQDRLAEEAISQAKNGNLDALWGAMDYPGLAEVVFKALFDAAINGHGLSSLAIKRLAKKHGETHAEVEE